MEAQTELNEVTLKDLKPKMQLRGIVRKVELFGAFIDVGAENDGWCTSQCLSRGMSTVPRILLNLARR